MNKTKIQWCDATWNPVTGCTPISAGCANCYARRMARRLAGRCGYPEAPHEFDVTLHPERLDEPLRWRKPRRIFVCSMNDLFHEDVPTEYVSRVWRQMYKAHQHTFLILTKRSFRMAQILSSRPVEYAGEPVMPEFITPPNVWCGVTIEEQEYDTRIHDLINTPVAKRFVSFEPLLSEITISPESLRQIDWMIVGCESGPNRRFTSRQWIRSLRDQCLALGDDRPAFFLKQMDVGGKVVEMPELDGRTWAEMPGGERE